MSGADRLSPELEELWRDALGGQATDAIRWDSVASVLFAELDAVRAELAKLPSYWERIREENSRLRAERDALDYKLQCTLGSEGQDLVAELYADKRKTELELEAAQAEVAELREKLEVAEEKAWKYDELCK